MSDNAQALAVGEVLKNTPPSVDYLIKRFGTAGPAAAGAASSGGAGVPSGGDKPSASATAIGMVPGLAYDLAGYFVGGLFDQYCERFAGPFQGTFHVDFLNDEGEPWWRYDVQITGRLDLRYAKSAAGGPIRMSGEFYGTGTRFTLWERNLQNLNKKLMAGAVTFKKYITPTGAPFLEFEGRYIGAFGPLAFFVPVEGELLDSTLTLRIQEAKTDFHGVSALGIYVIASPRTMGYPVVLTTPFPYTGARSIIRKSLDGETSPVVLRVRLDRAGKKMSIDSTAVRNRVQGDGFLYNTKLTLRACNPEC
jgi:hypothetical protein